MIEKIWSHNGTRTVEPKAILRASSAPYQHDHKVLRCRTLRQQSFFADRTNGRAYATVLRLLSIFNVRVRPRAKVTIDSLLGSRIYTIMM